MRRSMLALAVCLMTGSAQAGVVDLDYMMKGANIYALNNFSSQWSDVEGAVLAGGNVTTSGYTFNQSKTAGHQGYALVARGDLTMTGGEVMAGKIYVGGKSTTTNTNKIERSPDNPFDFEAAAAYYQALSGDLAKVNSTGSVRAQSEGVIVSGSGGGIVDVFNVSADMFRNASSWGLENLTMGQTLIFNVSGANAGFREYGISFEPLRNYNVLFNFPDAVELNIKGMIGSVLAPKATVSDNWGQVNGQVVVNNWNSTNQINANHFFRPVELDGFRDPPPVVTPEQPVDVPEPGTLALLLLGAGMVLAVRRGRKAPAEPSRLALAA